MFSDQIVNSLVYVSTESLKHIRQIWSTAFKTQTLSLHYSTVFSMLLFSKVDKHLWKNEIYYEESHDHTINRYYYTVLSHKDWELPISRIWLSEMDIDRGIDFPTYTSIGNVLKWKGCKLRCKSIDCFHLTIFISVSAKKLMKKKVKRKSKLWKN